MTSQTLLRRAVQSVLIAILLSGSQLHAASLPPAARGETEGLLSRLAASGCQFNRNGGWHKASEARTHLRRKLDCLEDKDAVGSTEQFIVRAATKSSMSGKPYQVRCSKRAPVASSQWLRTELQAMRAGNKHKAATRELQDTAR